MAMSKRLAWTLVLVVLIVGAAGFAGASDGKVYRVGYLEGGQYWAFDKIFGAFQKSLGTEGLADRVAYPEDARFSPGWEADDEAMFSAADKLMARDDLDLIVAMGTTAASVLLERNNGTTPILGMGVSDPVKAGLIPNEQDSGTDNFTVRILPDRWKVMFNIFHEIVRFDKLGVLYPNTEAGHTYTNLVDAREVARERGFELLEYSSISSAETTEECLKGLKALRARGMDAFFIPALNSFDWSTSDVQVLYEYLIQEGIPTFARDGSEQVKGGALLGFSTLDFGSTGLFLARNAVRILEGELPRSLNMTDVNYPSTALNFAVADAIGFDFSLDELISADEIYLKIEPPKDRKYQ